MPGDGVHFAGLIQRTTDEALSLMAEISVEAALDAIKRAGKTTADVDWRVISEVEVEGKIKAN